MANNKRIFIAGGTGYMGGRLIPILLQRGHQVTVLARPGSEKKVPQRCRIVLGDALDEHTYKDRVDAGQTFVHMVGVAHPSPAKAKEFQTIDLPAALASMRAAVASRAKQLVYVSVAHPASIMKAYVATRMEVEARIRESGLRATFLRPWYVLGPGHRWAYLVRPVYWLMEQIPSTRESALRLGLVTLSQMTAALVNAIETEPEGIRVVEVPAIRQASL